MVVTWTVYSGYHFPSVHALYIFFSYLFEIHWRIYSVCAMLNCLVFVDYRVVSVLVMFTDCIVVCMVNIRYV